ncbi:hypothetical protein HK105_202254 [Polyrhizophydium stewartii]|uniref:Uncharacterized protein n=1 Tax=Polyrhizophydium stewartii TaxID=2732419 RepID=A0ABR4NFN9_9FUNG
MAQSKRASLAPGAPANPRPSLVPSSPAAPGNGPRVHPSPRGETQQQQSKPKRVAVDLHTTASFGSGSNHSGGGPTSIPLKSPLPGGPPAFAPTPEQAAAAALRARVGSFGAADEARRKAKALVHHRWDMLRAHVMRGFFHSIMNRQTGVVPDDFISIVSNLWTQVLLHASSARLASDSTIDFVATTGARQRPSASTALVSSPAAPATAAGPRPALLGAQTNMTAAARKMSALPSGSQATGMISLTSATAVPASMSNGSVDPNASLLDTSHLGRGVGLDGLSLDNVPNCNIGRTLMLIAKGLHSPSKKDEADFFTLQVHLNRAWKLLLLGLTQAESFSRHVAMIALCRALPVIKETLVDNQTRFNIVSVLVNLVVSDERQENRIKAVYLLGQLGATLASVREYHQLMLTVFKELARKLLEIQYSERLASATNPNLTEIKVHLFHAIGKFTRVSQKKSHFIEDLVMYMIYHELSLTERMMVMREKTSLESSDPELFVVMATLSVLNNEVCDFALAR